MSFLRPGIAALASRPLASPVSRTAASQYPGNASLRTFTSQHQRQQQQRQDTPEDTPAANDKSLTTKTSSYLERKDPAVPPSSETLDYNAPVDHGTSNFSPVPRRVLDGSEGDSVPAAVVSGAPLDLQARTVRIYRPTKPASQSGTWHSSYWRMDWDVPGKGYRWENPLIGWQSSADEMQGTKLTFHTKEDAIRFAEKQGYEYSVQEPNERRIRPKTYAENFAHSAGKLKYIKTK